jgi:hypothetical protein
MSKQSSTPGEDDMDLPPPYAEAFPASSSPLPSLPSQDSPIATLITTLQTVIKTTQKDHTTTQALCDSKILSHIFPHLQNYLTALATTTPPPTNSELVLVPAAAVPSDWTLSADRDRREGEARALARVSDTQDKKSSGVGAGGGGSSSVSARLADYDDRTINEWGTWSDDVQPARAPGNWWWKDEGMASRLSRLLQPKTQPKVDRQIVKQVVQQTKQEKKRGWGLFGGNQSTPPPAPTPVVAAANQVDDGVVTTVRPEEVTFRRENEFGVWESMNGWGIVVRVKIR